MARNQDADWQAMKFSAWAHSSAPRVPSPILSLSAWRGSLKVAELHQRLPEDDGEIETDGPTLPPCPPGAATPMQGLGAGGSGTAVSHSGAQILHRAGAASRGGGGAISAASFAPAAPLRAQNGGNANAWPLPG